MPRFLVRIERCLPYEIVVEAPSSDDAEILANRISLQKWEAGCEYTQDLETYPLEDEDDRPPVATSEEE